MKKYCLILTFLCFCTLCFAETAVKNSAEGIEKMNDSSLSVTKIMSVNLLTTSKQPIKAANGKNPPRDDLLIELIKETLPDSIGCQEVTEEWLSCLENKVSDYCFENASYSVTGKKSSSGIPLKSSSSEYSPVLYRKDKYKLLESGGWWFSETPDIPSKFGDLNDSNGALQKGMKYNRVFCYAILENKKSGEKYIHLNCHFDHKSSDYVNCLCSKALAEKAKELSEKSGNIPVVISGDFNSEEYSSAYLYLADKANGFSDTKYGTENSSGKGTFTGFGIDFSAGRQSVIDHIFVLSSLSKTLKFEVFQNGKLSDHAAIMSTVHFGVP